MDLVSINVRKNFQKNLKFFKISNCRITYCFTGVGNLFSEFEKLLRKPSSMGQLNVLWYTPLLALIATLLFSLVLFCTKARSGTVRCILLAGISLFYIVVVQTLVMRSGPLHAVFNPNPTNPTGEVITGAAGRTTLATIQQQDSMITFPIPPVIPDYALLGIWRARDLNEAYLRYKSNDPLMVQSVNAAFQNIEKSMQMPLQSVMRKSLTAPSGDKHDWYSRTFYKPGEDGEMHPDVFSDKYDKVALWDMQAAVQDLAIAYFWTGEEIFAERVAELVRTWFTNPDTMMNPHFIYSSVDPESSIKEGRQYVRFPIFPQKLKIFRINDSYDQGLVESHPFKVIIDSLALVAKSSSAWDRKIDTIRLRRWFRDLALWFCTHEFGHLEERSGNNHQTGFYVMLNYMFIINGEKDLARRFLDFAKYKLVMQFTPAGEQLRELKRPDAWWYVGYNLDFMSEIAIMADSVGVDFWNFRFGSCFFPCVF
jgi:hypothetical protein